MNINDQEKEKIKAMIDRGEPLPPKYKLLLFDDAKDVELIWSGKTDEVTNVVLPFQSIEQIDEPRTEDSEQFGLFRLNQLGRQAGGWSNKLIWGDNKLVLSSLKNGPLRREIEDAGGLKLIYIDPPFDVGADFSVNIDIGEEQLTKEPSIIEELAYRDTWGRGADSYLTMMYERLKLMHDLLADDGSIYVHCDWRVNSYMRLLLDEVFHKENFKNQIAWCYTGPGYYKEYFVRKHDYLLFFSKSNTHTFNPQYVSYKSGIHVSKEGKVKTYGNGIKESRVIEIEERGKPKEDWWDDIYTVDRVRSEIIGFETQKPEALLERITNASSKEGDLIADFFCGSGTTLAVAEKLGRKWIGCDLGRFAIHTTRKRLIGVQRELKAEGKPYRSFEILNLGKYERQYFVGINPNLSEEERRAQTCQKEEQYLSLILSAYKAQRVSQMPPFHGKQGSTTVVVGPIDAPITLMQVNDIVEACRREQISKVDVLGFEFEMGLTPTIQDEARGKGVSLSLKYIPKDVFDKRAVEKGQIQFYDVAYVEVLTSVKDMKTKVKLVDFGVFYRQDDVDVIGEKLKNNGSKVTVVNGQVVKISKSGKGIVKQEILTKKWSDWIDYWAVDFNFKSKKEIVRVVENGEEKEIWTGNYIFENQWQSYRTRKDRKLRLTSVLYEYPKKGKYKIAVKVIDIFGNDTTKVVEVKI